MNYNKMAPRRTILRIFKNDGSIDEISEGITSGSMKLKRNLCEDSGDLAFGGCVPSEFTVEVYEHYDLIESNAHIQVLQELEDTEGNKVIKSKFFGRIDSFNSKESDYSSIITAYDDLYYYGDIDVISWYYGLWTDGIKEVSLRYFFESLMDYVGLSIAESCVITQDDMTVSENIYATELSFKRVLKYICEICGGFGYINADGDFTIVYLNKERATNILDVSSGYRFEEYTVQAINKVQIKSEEEDIGAVYPDIIDSTNALVIQGNFLCFGKSSEELEDIARKLYDTVSGLSYTPIQCSLDISDPELDLDGIKYIFRAPAQRVGDSDISVESYILGMMYSGVQLFDQTLESYGDEVRSEVVYDSNSEIVATKYKTLKIRKDVDALSVRLEATSEVAEDAYNKSTEISADVSSFKVTVTQAISDLQEEIDGEIPKTYATKSELAVTANEITTEVSKEINGVKEQYTTLKQTVDEIDASVVKDDEVISAINLSKEGVKIKGDKVDITGAVTFSALADDVEEAITGAEQKASKSVANVVVFYGVNNSNSTPPTSWSTDTKKAIITSEKPYLWAYNEYEYADGTRKIGEKSVIGHYGTDGINGTNGKDGLNGKDGEDGTNGKDGSSVTISSTSTTYQASSSQTTVPTGNWSTIIPTLDSSKPYLWTKTVVNYSPSGSTTSYSVSSTLNGVEVGGRNYFSKYSATTPFTSDEYTLADYQSKGSFTQFRNMLIPMSSFVGKKAKLSFDVISPNGATTIQIYNRNGEPRYILTEKMFNLSANLWTHIDMDFVVTDRGSSYTDSSSINDKIEIYMSSQMKCRVKNVMLEYGTVATAWSPAPEDITVLSVLPLYYAKTTSGAPSAPTSEVTATGTGTNAWTLVQPKIGNGIYVYTCQQTKMVSGLLSWSAVRIEQALTDMGSWCSANDVTKIDGGKIYTGSITASQINVNNLTSDRGFITSLSTNSIKVGNPNLIEPEWYNEVPWKGLIWPDKHNGLNCYRVNHGILYEAGGVTNLFPKMTYEANTQYTISVEWCNELPSYRGMAIIVTYTDETTDVITDYYSGTPDFEKSFMTTALGKTISKITSSYWYGGNTWMRNLKIEKGTIPTNGTPLTQDDVFTLGTTSIDGGKITTGSIDCACLKADTTITNHITADNLDIKGGSVNITTNSTTSDTIVLKYGNSMIALRPNLLRLSTSDGSITFNETSSGKMTALFNCKDGVSIQNGSLSVSGIISSNGNTVATEKQLPFIVELTSGTVKAKTNTGFTISFGKTLSKVPKVLVNVYSNTAYSDRVLSVHSVNATTTNVTVNIFNPYSSDIAITSTRKIVCFVDPN